MENKNLFSKMVNGAKSMGQKAVRKVKDDPLGTLLLVTSVGLSAYSAIRTVKRGDVIEQVGCDEQEIPGDEEPEDEEVVEN
jgi:hypothetical protein